MFSCVIDEKNMNSRTFFWLVNSLNDWFANELNIAEDISQWQPKTNLLSCNSGQNSFSISITLKKSKKERSGIRWMLIFRRKLYTRLVLVLLRNREEFCTIIDCRSISDWITIFDRCSAGSILTANRKLKDGNRSYRYLLKTNGQMNSN